MQIVLCVCLKLFRLVSEGWQGEWAGASHGLSYDVGLAYEKTNPTDVSVDSLLCCGSLHFVIFQILFGYRFLIVGKTLRFHLGII